MPRPMLLFGCDGQLGRSLVAELVDIAPLVALGRAEVDLTNTAAIRQVIAEHAPSVVINAAAYTAVDAAESDAAAAFAVNARAVEAIAGEALRQDALLVHFSTDYVFGGEATRPYVEDDLAEPLNVYGASKLAGEKAILASEVRALIFRISWLYAAHGRNFLRTIIQHLRTSTDVRVVDDQQGTPTWTGAVAAAVHDALEQCRSSSDRFDAANDRLGLYHLSSGEAATWFGFASAICEMLPHRYGGSVTPIPTSQFPRAARRPRNSVLNSEKLRASFGVRLAPWREQLSMCAADLE